MNSYNLNIPSVITLILAYRNQYREEKRLKNWIRSSKKNHSIINPILVYQMGKVASTSIYESLKLLRIGVPIYHIHLLNPTTIKRQKQYIKNLIRQCIKKVVSLEVVEGYPAEVILKKVDEWDCDIIIMGTHGKGVISNIFLGSVAARVLRRVRKPVFVIPLPEGEIDITFHDA